MVYDFADKPGCERGWVYVNGVKACGTRKVIRIYHLVGVEGNMATLTGIDFWGQPYTEVLPLDTIEKLEVPIER